MEKGLEKLPLDIMVEGGAKFYCTLVFLYNPLFRLTAKDLEDFVLQKCPSLKHRKFEIHFDV